MWVSAQRGEGGPVGGGPDGGGEVGERGSRLGETDAAELVCTAFGAGLALLRA